MKPILFCAALTALLLWTTAATNAQSNSPLPPTTTLEITGEQIGSADTEEVAYADLDSDGDGDAFIMALDHNEIWFHQANHQFRKNGQSFGAGLQYDVALGDLDHDGDTDAFIVKQQTATDNASEVWLNDGQGNFSDSGQRLSSDGYSVNINVQLTDFDQDQDLDAFVVANGMFCGVSRLWRNDGHGQFVDSGQEWPGCERQVALGDLNQDQKPDILFNTNHGVTGLTVWSGLGNNTFTRTQTISETDSTESLALGDLDQDGDLDLLISMHTMPSGAAPVRLYNKVWLNDGTGHLQDSGQLLPYQGSQRTFTPWDDAVTLADLDHDGDLDGITVTRFRSSGRLAETTVVVQFNDGTGHFSQGLVRYLPPAAPTSITSDRIELLTLPQQLYLPLVHSQ